MANSKHEVDEITNNGLEIIFIKEVEDPEPEKDEGPEWEMKVFLLWKEGKDSEVKI